MPFCKICYDAGNSNYGTHNIKFYNLKLRYTEITCPYLKNITCTRCGLKSHTASYCKEDIKKINNNIFTNSENKQTKEIKKQIEKKQQCDLSNTLTNMFCILVNNNEEEETFEEKLNYTFNGEILGKLSDIVWGKGIKNNEKLWADTIV